MFGRADFRVIILIMLMAIILAVTAALAFYYLSTRPDFPEGTYETVVEDQPILIVSDPKLAAKIISTPNPEQPVAPEITVPPDGQGGGEGETVLPEETVIVLTPIPTPEQPIVLTPIPPTPIPPTAVPPRPDQVVFIDYQVVPGDTLYSISSKHNTTIALMARYGIDSTDIVPGTVIRLPVANPAYCPGNFPYVVEEGDTLSSIAVKCGTTVNNLMQINSFGPNFRLDVTSVICVPTPP